MLEAVNVRGCGDVSVEAGPGGSVKANGWAIGALMMLCRGNALNRCAVTRVGNIAAILVVLSFSARALAAERPSLFYNGATVGSGASTYWAAWAGLEAGENQILPFDVQVSNLSVRCTPPISAGTQYIVVRNAGVDSALTCSLNGGFAECSGTANDPVLIPAGAELPLRIGSTSGATVAYCVAMVGVTGGRTDAIVGTHQTSSPSGFAVGQFCGPANNINYEYPSGCTSLGEPTAAKALVIIPAATTATGLALKLSGAMTSGTTATIVLRNVTTGEDSDLAVTATAAASEVIDTTCTTQFTGRGPNCALNAGDKVVLVVTDVTGSPGNRLKHFNATFANIGQIVTARTQWATFGQYVSPNVISSTEAKAVYPIDRDGVIRNFWANCSKVVTDTRDTVWQVCAGNSPSPSCGTQRDGTGTGIGCTMTKNVDADCHDTAHTVPVLQGDYFTVYVGANSDTDDFAQSCTYSFELAAYLRGDATCDDRLTAADLTALVLSAVTGEHGTCGFDDVNGDSVVDDRDIGLLHSALFN